MYFTQGILNLLFPKVMTFYMKFIRQTIHNVDLFGTTYYFNLTVYSCLFVCIICVLLHLTIIHKQFMELSIYKFMSIFMAVILNSYRKLKKKDRFEIDNKLLISLKLCIAHTS